MPMRTDTPLVALAPILVLATICHVIAEEKADAQTEKLKMNASPKHTNKLADETSPYLLQHRHNPVDWYPWGLEAFEKAQSEDKPIFLSVGYSACHWCHVMEHEVFEHEEVGALLREYFVCIKVDREERPDVDDIYMKYIHMTSGRGGWPMSIAMTPQGAPFYGFTYQPKAPFMKLMLQLAAVWAQDRAKVDAAATSAVEGLRVQAQATPQREATVPLGPELLKLALAEMTEYFDQDEGGLRGQMKFPPHSNLELLVRLLDRPQMSERLRSLTLLTLDKMQLGGIKDHLGGGFHRYATDAHWLLPHFEKMLYDNAQLASYYARAAKLLGNENYARTARETLDWILRDLTSPDGVFYSAYDADSEGEEGKFYVWTQDELVALLGSEAELFLSIYNIEPAGNYLDEATHVRMGTNIPHLKRALDREAALRGMQAQELTRRMQAACEKLLSTRNKRVWPGLDNKILTGWNALAISAFARAAVDLNEPRYQTAALRAAEWILKYMRNEEGRWYATHNRGISKLSAYLDDHAYLANAFLDLHAATGDRRWQQEAEQLVALMNRHFWDDENGGYFFVADDHERLLVRMKTLTDNATPSGNGIAAQVLARLGQATGKKRYLEHATKLLELTHAYMQYSPLAVESMLLALYLRIDPGSRDAQATTIAVPVRRPMVESKPLRATLLVGKDKFPAGGAIPIAVKLEIDEGFHVQAHETTPELIPAQLKLKTEALGEMKGIRYPAVKLLKQGETELKVYSGTVFVSAWLKVPADIDPGTVQLSLELQIQACDQTSCLAPQKLLLQEAVEVVPASSPAMPRHVEVFEKLFLGEAP